MAKRRTAAEIKRSLKRRLKSMPSDDVARLVDELRDFAVAHKFFSGYTTAFILEQHLLVRPMTQRDIEHAVRSHGGMK